MTVGERIRNKRIELNMSQEELGRRVGFKGNSTKTRISRYENAGDEISMKQIKKIASALNVSFAYLMGWGNDEVEIEVAIPDDSIKRIETYAKKLSEIISPDTDDSKTMIMKYSKLPTDAQKTVNDLVDSMYNTYYLQKGDSKTNSESLRADSMP